MIELLVVIAIIAILAAILLPVFSRAREKGRQIACASGARQVGMAFAMYVQDYDELTPRIWFGVNSRQQRYFWMDVLLPYVKSVAFFSSCPSKTFGDWTPSPPVPPATFQQVRLSRVHVAFAANSLYGGGSQSSDLRRDGQPTNPPMTHRSNSLAQFEVPAETIVFGDGTGYYICYSSNKQAMTVELEPPFSGGRAFPSIGRSGGTFAARYVGRHFDGANWAFADGHAKWMLIRDVARTNSNGIMHIFTIEDDKGW